MSTVAIFKWGMNPHDQHANADGSVKWLADRPDVGDDDYMAVQVAVALAEGGEVVGLTLANGDTAFAASRGADRTVIIDGLPITAQPLDIAKALAEAIKGMGDVDAVVIGDSAWEPAVPGLLAGLLGWPAVMAVDGAKREGGNLVVTRRFGAGTQDLALTGPAVLAVAARREEENKPGMRVVLQARKKPSETVALADLKTPAASMEVQGYHEPSASNSNVIDGSDPEVAAQQLLQFMKGEGVL